MLAVGFVLAATLTLLPAVLARLGPRVDSSRCRGCTRTRSAPSASAPGAGGFGAARSLWDPRPRAARRPGVAGPELSTRCPRSRSSPGGLLAGRLWAGQAAFGPGAPVRCRSLPRARTAGDGVLRRDPASPRSCPDRPMVMVLVGAIPAQVPPPRSDGRSTGFADIPAGPASVALSPSTTTSRSPLGDPRGDRRCAGPRFPAAAARTSGPAVAAVGVVTNLLATGAAFGVAKWIFQDGAL